MPDKSETAAMFTDTAGTPLKMAEGKAKLSLVPLEAVEALARVYEHGLVKYERDSWRKFTPEQASACLPDAALRHLLAYCSGEVLDPDSRLPHLAQVAWNCLTLHLITQQKEAGDGPNNV